MSSAEKKDKNMNSEITDDTIVVDKVEATSAKRVKGMPYVLGLSTLGAIVVLAIATIASL